MAFKTHRLYFVVTKTKVDLAAKSYLDFIINRKASDLRQSKDGTQVIMKYSKTKHPSKPPAFVAETARTHEEMLAYLLANEKAWEAPLPK